MKRLFVAFIISLLCVSFVAAVGTQPKGYEPQFQALAVGDGLQPFATENGKISWSIDASGSNTGSDTIQVDKPAGATVRKAFLMAATTGFTGYQITGTDVSLAGSPVTWDTEVANGIGSFNYLTDVTAIVKPIIDGAPAGVSDLTVTETLPGSVDGETLVVVFDDASKPDSTVILAFGAQQTTGDTFNIGLSDPVDTSAPGFLLDMSLGISFSYQSFASQYSQIVVNGQSLTTSAGGNDDGEYQNGALITTGGVGDSKSNPIDPNQNADGSTDFTRYDDELYDLTGIVGNGVTSIDATTLNPSNDDNIYFAGFLLGATTAVVGEGIVLSPQSATNPVGTTHTVTATVQNDLGNPVANTAVTFEIVSGPNAGLTDVIQSGADGKASFSWSSSVAGTDEVKASFVNSLQQTQESNHVTKTWALSDEIPEFGLVGAVVIGMMAAIGLVAFRKR